MLRCYQPTVPKPFRVVDFLHQQECLFISRDREWTDLFHKDMVFLNAWPEFPQLTGRTIVYFQTSPGSQDYRPRQFALVLAPGPWRTTFLQKTLRLYDAFAPEKILFPLEFGSWPLQLEFPSLDAYQKHLELTNV